MASSDPYAINWCSFQSVIRPILGTVGEIERRSQISLYKVMQNKSCVINRQINLSWAGEKQISLPVNHM